MLVMGRSVNPAFGAWLRGRIGPRSYGHLATYVGVATSTVSRWITGESAPEYRNRLKLAEYLDASIEEVDEFFESPGVPLDTAGAVRGSLSPGGVEGAAGADAGLLAEVALPLLTGDMTAEERAWLEGFARRVRERRAAAGGRDDAGRGGAVGAAG